MLKNKIRIVTAATLFDGHDASINIMRRVLQSMGTEIIHLGHNRSAYEIVEAAIEEDVQAVALTSYQGGHVEYFKYVRDLLNQNGYQHIKIFGGGGGTILPSEIIELENYGIAKIYAPEDGRKMGLEGMIKNMLEQCDFSVADLPINHQPIHLEKKIPVQIIARSITKAEEQQHQPATDSLKRNTIPVLGITGTGGAGKSSVIDEITRLFLDSFPTKNLAILSIDPSQRKTGGALLGDRIRMNAINSPRCYMRSLATRDNNTSLSKSIQSAIDICKQAAFDLIILETSGIGQSDSSITDFCDIALYIMTPEYGAPSQLEKINMLDFADIICINKFDKAGAHDAYHDVCRQFIRNHKLWDTAKEDLPIVSTNANKFNDAGVHRLFHLILKTLEQKTKKSFALPKDQQKALMNPTVIIPSNRTNYLSEIVDCIRNYDRTVEKQAAIASKKYQLAGALALVQSKYDPSQPICNQLTALQDEFKLEKSNQHLLDTWNEKKERYQKDQFEYTVRDKKLRQPLTTITLSNTKIRKVVLPNYQDWGDILRWQLQENVPGEFPYTAGVFPLKNSQEAPTRMFAGEGTPERTNRRFHYLSQGQSSIRLSTAFDSITLYGENPDYREDIYGKIGNSGVSIATLDDAKKLYSGFDLCAPSTSVSMTINGPAPILLAFFLNTAIDQQCEKHIKALKKETEVATIYKKLHPNLPKPEYVIDNNLEAKISFKDFGLLLLGLTGDDILDEHEYALIKQKTLQSVRGTVQADILKEEQAQNTCIFSVEFALKLMGDVQEYFIKNKIKNFYNVSISGYHIAEAGANPITQLAFTLSNGFTYVEYYLSKGMSIDDFTNNFSFFFSNGMDAEYSVIGRVARRIWAKAIKLKYNGNERSQKLKYHIQTSGRSLHAQEIDFNDIRTTLQALYAIYDNCNSLHTNAYDEAVTTPTEDSVRRAIAIQLIINQELGTTKNENLLQGSFFLEELTNLVEEAVLLEFERISERGGCLGAMERMYQRNKIQEESMYYEKKKLMGDLPIMGVNTFLNPNGNPASLPKEIIRSSKFEKEQQIKNLEVFHKRNELHREEKLKKLKTVALQGGNIFEELMEAVKYCSLGDITHALYEVGGKYRRNM
ncbi:MAG: methylmalonyl-CoA mutase family protein [Phycisphaerales bacterium]|nr:methylmalonyl-CoA mutase family protein [Phycisphaerales bacterium]